MCSYVMFCVVFVHDGSNQVACSKCMYIQNCQNVCSSPTIQFGIKPFRVSTDKFRQLLGLNNQAHQELNVPTWPRCSMVFAKWRTFASMLCKVTVLSRFRNLV